MIGRIVVIAAVRRRARLVAGHVEDGRIVGRSGRDQEAEGGAAAAVAGELDEGQVVASGEDPDPPGRDGRPAGGARGAVGKRSGTIAGIHRRPVYRSAAPREMNARVDDTPREYDFSERRRHGARQNEEPDRR